MGSSMLLILEIVLVPARVNNVFISVEERSELVYEGSVFIVWNILYISNQTAVKRVYAANYRKGYIEILIELGKREKMILSGIVTAVISITVKGMVP